MLHSTFTVQIIVFSYTSKIQEFGILLSNFDATARSMHKRVVDFWQLFINSCFLGCPHARSVAWWEVTLYPYPYRLCTSTLLFLCRFHTTMIPDSGRGCWVLMPVVFCIRNFPFSSHFVSMCHVIAPRFDLSLPPALSLLWQEEQVRTIIQSHSNTCTSHLKSASQLASTLPQ